MGDTLCPELLPSQVWRWPQVLLREVLFLFAPAFYCSDCFLVTCLAQLLCLLREINPISVISTGQEGKAGDLTLSGKMAIRMELGEGGTQRGISGRTGRPLWKLIGSITSQNLGPGRHRPLLLCIKWEKVLAMGLRASHLPPGLLYFLFQTRKNVTLIDYSDCARDLHPFPH